MKTIRELISRLLNGCGNIDDAVHIKIVRRDSQGAVTHTAIIPIAYVDSADNIAIEESSIQMKEGVSSRWPDVTKVEKIT